MKTGEITDIKLKNADQSHFLNNPTFLRALAWVGFISNACLVVIIFSLLITSFLCLSYHFNADFRIFGSTLGENTNLNTCSNTMIKIQDFGIFSIFCYFLLNAVNELIAAFKELKYEYRYK